MADQIITGYQIVHVRAAEPIGDQVITPTKIIIEGHYPTATKQECERLAQQFKIDAWKIFNALRSLPGGTFDQLLILMLQASASSFVVPHNFREREQAAPDLLEACKAFVDVAPSEGHRCLYCDADVYSTNSTDEHLPDCEMTKGYAAIAKAEGKEEEHGK